MSKEKVTEIAELKKDIKEMHKMMNMNASSFRFIYSTKNFRFFFLIAGCWAAFFSITYHIIQLFFGFYTPVPWYVMACYFILFGAGWLGLIILQTVISMRAAKELHLKVNIFGLIRELLATRMWLVIVPVLLFFILIPLKNNENWAGTDYLPYTGIVTGLVLNSIGIMIREKEYSFTGMWLILSGLTGFIFIKIPIHLALGVVFAPGCFLFAIVAYCKKKKE